MHIYIRNQRGDALIEKGKILIIGSAKRNCIFTGEDELKLTFLGEYKNEKEAEEVLGHIISRIVSPTAREVERGSIYIDLENLEI